MNELPVPLGGISKCVAVDKESPSTSGYMNNVRPQDVLGKRLRLGQRPALDKWSTTQIGGAEFPIVAMTVVSTLV